jgi:hypothetical protein
MMQTPLVLRLPERQAGQLVAACAAYRKYALQCLPPSPERNQMMRAVQAVEGRLRLRCTPQPSEVIVSLSQEEGNALRQMLSALTRAYGAELPSEKRVQVLGDLAALRLLVERALRQTQVL